jgi:hypothetical protein
MAEKCSTLKEALLSRTKGPRLYLDARDQELLDQWRSQRPLKTAHVIVKILLLSYLFVLLVLGTSYVVNVKNDEKHYSKQEILDQAKDTERKFSIWRKQN